MQVHTQSSMDNQKPRSMVCSTTTQQHQLPPRDHPPPQIITQALPVLLKDCMATLLAAHETASTGWAVHYVWNILSDASCSPASLQQQAIDTLAAAVCNNDSTTLLQLLLDRDVMMQHHAAFPLVLQVRGVE